MKKTRTSTARSKAFVEAAKLQSGEMSTIKDSNDEDLIPSRSTIARVVARHVNDSSDSNQQHRHSSAFKRDRGPPDRSSAMEPCLNDRSPPEMWICGRRSEIARYRNACCSSESWEPQTAPTPWHCRARGGAVHSIKTGLSEGNGSAMRAWTVTGWPILKKCCANATVFASCMR
jgi:hypothetical protein